MPLTRHFYKLEEVEAMILYSGSRALPKETVFWTHELVQSDHASEAIRILFESWLWHRGPFHLAWLTETMERLGGSEVSQEDILLMADALSRCTIRDHSLWYLMAVSTISLDSLYDSITLRSPLILPSEDPLEVFFIRAIYQHKAGSAWWAGVSLGEDRMWTLMEWYCDHVCSSSSGSSSGSGSNSKEWRALREYERLLGYRSTEYDRALRGLALLSLCLTPSQREQSLAPCSLFQDQIQEQEQKQNVIGYRASRILSVSPYGLYGSGRGRMRSTETTMGELYDVLQGMKGCSFWDDVTTFTDDLFPDDLPDEWSAAEKEKSHGAGILSQKESLSLWGWMRRYHSGRSRLLWGKAHWVARRSEIVHFFEGIEFGESPYVSLLSIPIPIPEITPIQLRPVHKQKRVG